MKNLIYFINKYFYLVFTITIIILKLTLIRNKNNLKKKKIISKYLIKYFIQILKIIFSFIK